KSFDDLEEFLRGLVVRDVMLTRARDEGIDNDPKVQEEVRTRIDQYLIERWKKNVTKKLELYVEAGSADASILRLASAEDVPNPLVRARYDRFRENYQHPAELSVREILVRTHPEAEELLKEIRIGASFSDLARSRSLRRSSAERGGETGYRSVGDFGGAGSHLMSAQDGDLVGPLSVDSYYAIYQVIGRRPARLKSLKEAEPQVKRELVMEAKFRAYGKMVETLRSGRSVAVDEDLLRSLSIP
ncbi:MAG TPA: peptidylprolyl isomerase, partial [Bacteroidota bacterium]